MKLKSKVLILFLVMFMVIGSAGVLAQETVKIGTVLPITGGLASYGQV